MRSKRRGLPPGLFLPVLRRLAVYEMLRRSWGWLAARFQGRPQAGQLLLWLLRGVFGAIVISMAMVAFQHVYEASQETAQGWIAFSVILGGGLLLILTD